MRTILSVLLISFSLLAYARPYTGYTIGVKISIVGDGESFVFGLNGSAVKVTVSKGNFLVNFPGTYPAGYQYAISQLSGPRTCQLIPNTGTLANSNVVVICNCGNPPGKSLLSGYYTAPVGVNVVIQKDSTTDLTLVSKPNGNAALAQTHFNFPTPYTNGLPYTLNIKSVPPGITCMISKGKRGTTGLSPDFIRVCADYSYDLLTRSSDNKFFGTYYESQSPVTGGKMEEEGRYVSFVSSAVGLGNSKGKHRQIFWRDRKTGETKLISIAANGEEGNGDSFEPAISADGKSVVFESYSTNLVVNDNNGVRDIFKWSAADGTVTRVSINAAGMEANGTSGEPTISGDGSIIAFSSGADNLTAGVSGNSTINVYLKDLTTGAVKLISADMKTKKGVGGSNPSISENGSRLAFYSYASSLVEGDKNGLWDIFFYNNTNQSVKRISLTANGGERNQGTESASRVVAPTISGDGNYIAYASTASNIVAGDNNGVQDVFLCNVETGKTERVSVNSNGQEGNADSPIGQGEKIAVSFDGRLVVFTSNATNLGAAAGNVWIYDQQSRQLKPVTTFSGSSAGRPAVSAFGAYVVFGMGTKLDGRFPSSGLFANYTGLGPCINCR